MADQPTQGPGNACEGNLLREAKRLELNMTLEEYQRNIAVPALQKMFSDAVGTAAAFAWISGLHG